MRFISISKYPGKMGEFFFNAAFKKLKIKASYKPIKKHTLSNLRTFLKKREISGSGVSMPFKEKIIKYLDELDISVIRTNSCNTITFQNEIIKGYNTDTLGIEKFLKNKKISKKLQVYIFGAGGYSRSFYEALNNLKFEKIFIINKSKKRFNSWPIKNKIKKIKKYPNSPSMNIIINATPIGMKQIKKKEFLSKLNLSKTVYYFECVVSPKLTNNVIIAKNKNINIVYGYEISIEQALIQLQIYVNRILSKTFIKKKINKFLK